MNSHSHHAETNFAPVGTRKKNYDGVWDTKHQEDLVLKAQPENTSKGKAAI